MLRAKRWGFSLLIFCFSCIGWFISSFTLSAFGQGVGEAWVARYNGPGNSSDNATALAVDDSGNLYVTGWSAGSGTFDDYATIKYSSAGDTLWVRRYNDPVNSFDEASALAVDGSGNVYVTGSSTGSGTYYDYATIKYSSSGDTLWVRRYNGPGFGYDFANALAVDDSGNVYVTGRSYEGGSPYDYATIKYSPSGDTQWVRRYNGPGNGYDYAYALAVDGSGNVYVAGSSDGGGTLWDYATIKYSSTGDTLWVRRYSSPGYGIDVAHALAVDDSGNVYVTGYSASDSFYPYNNDYATIKYSACSAKPGDVNGDTKVNLSDIIYKVNYLFKGGLTPSPLCRADDNADTEVNLSDIIYEVNYVFKGGPAPLKSGLCCL